MKIVEFSYEELIAGVPVHENPRITAIDVDSAARRRIRDTVLGILGEEVADDRLFSGFEGTCVVGGVYTPTAQHIGERILFGVTGEQWKPKLSMSPGHYAYKGGRNEMPAVGAYNLADYKYDGHAVKWQVVSGLSVPETCTDIFIWR